MEMISGMASQADEKSLIEFWFRVQHFLRVRAKLSRAAGLHAREYELLLAVKAIPAGRGASVSLIAERLCLQHPVTTALVKSLVAKGLLRADRSPKDRRSLALKLTPKGARLLGELVLESVNGLQAEGPGLTTSLRRTIGNKEQRSTIPQLM